MKQILCSMGLLLFLTSTVPPGARACSPVKKSEPLSQTETDESKESIEQEGQGLYRFFGATLFATSAGDLATTEWGITQPGVYESNPLAANRNIRVTAHVLVPTVVWWTTNKMQRNGHHQAALWLRIGVTAAYGYALMHNLRTAGAASPPN